MSPNLSNQDTRFLHSLVSSIIKLGGGGGGGGSEAIIIYAL